MKKRVVSVVIVIISLMSISDMSFASDNIAGQARYDEIVELLELTGSYKLALQTMNQVMNASLDTYNKNHPNKKISDEVWARVIETALSEIDKNSYYKMMVPIYQKYLTESDIQGILTFYKSNVGKKLTSVLPAIIKEGLSSAQAWGKEIAQRIRPKIEKKLREMGYPTQNVG